jgi:hypothetical protein
MINCYQITCTSGESCNFEKFEPHWGQIRTKVVFYNTLSAIVRSFGKTGIGFGGPGGVPTNIKYVEGKQLHSICKHKTRGRIDYVLFIYYKPSFPSLLQQRNRCVLIKFIDRDCMAAFMLEFTALKRLAFR